VLTRQVEEQDSDSRLPPAVVMLGILGVAGIGAYLVAHGRWYLAVGLLFVIPGFVLVHRRPILVVTVWLLVAPLVTVTHSELFRRVFWIVHRGLPLVGVAALVVGALLGIRHKRLARLGWPELFMLAYVLATLVSIAYTSVDPLANIYLLYDRVVAPMLIYLILRLGRPSDMELRTYLGPALVFMLVSQTLIGTLSWVAPSVLPNEWLTHAQSRTTGSLRSPNLYGVSMLLAGLFVFAQHVLSKDPRRSPFLGYSMLGLSLFMVFMTFSRASWLAGLVVVAGLAFVVPRLVLRALVVALPVLVLVAAVGFLDEQADWASQRLNSEQSQNSALTRLPVVVASVRMIQERPLEGWGYENFDRYDFQFHGQFGELIWPEKDHSSHNLYLTLLAEQGLIGFVLFLAPAAYWVQRGLRVIRPFDRASLGDATWTLVGLLVIAGHLVVNQFTSLQIPFGFGIWWLALGLIAVSVDRRSRRALDGSRSTLHAIT
jgi:O-antigen ligase